MVYLSLALSHIPLGHDMVAEVFQLYKDDLEKLNVVVAGGSSSNSTKAGGGGGSKVDKDTVLGGGSKDGGSKVVAAERTKGAKLFLRQGVSDLEERHLWAEELGFADVARETAALIYKSRGRGVVGGGGGGGMKRVD